MIRFSFTGNVKDGKLDINRDEFERRLLHFEGKTVEIELKEWSDHKSRQYEKYYWGVILELASEYTGYTKDELHEVNKARHLPKRVFDIKAGQYITIAGSTRDLTLEEQMTFVEAVRREYAELGINIPDPVK